MRNVAISVGVLVLALVVWVATRKPLSIDEELGKLPPDERQALEAIASSSSPLSVGRAEVLVDP